MHGNAVGLLVLKSCANNNVAFRCEFNRIRHEIGQNLFEAKCIATDLKRQIMIIINRHVDLFFRSEWGEHIHHIKNRFFQIKIGNFKLKFPCINFRKIKHIIDQCQKVCRRFTNSLHIHLVFIIELTTT